jgi:hypothetical protein
MRLDMRLAMFFFFVCALGLHGCSSRNSSLPAVEAKGSAPGFAATQGRSLQPQDYDAYVSSSLSPQQRSLAKSLMASMPSNWRADFVYIDGSGNVWSNRGGQVNIRKETMMLPGTAHSGTALASSTPLAHTMSVPGLDDSTGPFVRVYGVNDTSAGFGYATIGCGTTNLQGGDQGFMYMGTFDPNLNNFDAGLDYTNDSKIQPFVNLGGNNYVYSGWNQQYTYSCNNHIVVASGIYNSTTGFLFTSLVTGVDPTTSLTPPNQVPVNSATSSWVFFSLPSGFSANQGSWLYNGSNYMTTQCVNCNEKLMTTIAFASGNNYGDDSSCFGACNGIATNDWDQVVMGVAIQPCGPTTNASQVCTIQYPVDSSVWFGGLQQEPSSSTSGAFTPTNNSYNQFQTGINLGFNITGGGRVSSVGRFNSYAPPCTLDSYGYCYTLVSNTQTSLCYWSIFRLYYPGYTTTYDVFSSTALVELATKTSWMPGSGPCNPVVSWSPSNPATTYGDPNLP